jgi:hypothetical protein
MRRKLVVLVLCLYAMMLIAGTAVAADKQDAIVNKLIEKGVITKEEAASLMEEKQKESKDFEKIVNALKGFKFGLLWYLSYQNGEIGDTDNGTGYSQFAIKRGYFRVTKEFFPWFAAHMTFDVTTVKDPEESGDDPNNLDGSIALRIKYAYGKFNLPDFAFFTKPYFEVGVVHMPWLDFEEHLNWYRCQDTMFMERNGLYNSADIGITFTSLFGGEMPKEYQEKVNSHYAGRYGSMSAGVYNGGGYHASEKNQNKALEGRLTIRPLPDIVPGLQVSYFGITGKGNKDTKPDWTVNNGFVSFEHEYVALTGQYYWGKGNQKGDDENERDGYSVFAELKPHKKFSIIGRYDFFDPNTDSDTDKENKRYIVGAAYHLDKQHKNMVLLDYDHVDYDSQSGISDDKRIQLTLQVAL